MKEKRQTYTREFKVEAMRLSTEEGDSIRETAESLGERVTNYDLGGKSDDSGIRSVAIKVRLSKTTGFMPSKHSKLFGSSGEFVGRKSGYWSVCRDSDRFFEAWGGQK